MKKKKGLFRHLAWNGIKNNYKLYAPYILAAVGMTAMFFIILSLSMSPLILSMEGGNSAGIVLSLGVFVIGIFAVIFMFYTNSFLIKTRTKEFGLYNILGMSRRHIAKIVALETLMAAAASIVGGILVGALFEKLAEILFIRLIGEEATYELSINISACIITCIVFLGIFLLVMLRSMFRIFRLKTIDLIKSENFGEKPPKAKWVMTVIGLLLLGGAYYLAVVMAAPVQAITMFFVAVIMVILATYILFISGSISMCRALQKNKKYYYKSNHFVSLSSMVYRMKRNGAGLASICILSTMVLVMISSTSCLYFGKEASLAERYPKNISFEMNFSDDITDEQVEAHKAEFREKINKTARDNGYTIDAPVEFSILYNTQLIYDGVMTGDARPIDLNVNQVSYAWDIYFVDIADYNRYYGTDRTIADDEAIMCVYADEYAYDSITVPDGTKYTVVDEDRDFFRFGEVAANINPSILFVVNRVPVISGGKYRDFNTEWMYAFDVDVPASEQYDAYMAFCNSVYDFRQGDARDKDGMSSYDLTRATSECRELNRADFFGMYGGLFFLGIALSIVFTFALVLIIYYKQISEGYEDRARYEIMRKVGMTRDDIRRNVNSQMGSVFYMPLVAAVIHLCFACPMIFSMLKLFSVTKLNSLLLTGAISIAIFGVIYTIVYKITSNSYYKLITN